MKEDHWSDDLLWNDSCKVVCDCFNVQARRDPRTTVLIKSKVKPSKRNPRTPTRVCTTWEIYCWARRHPVARAEPSLTNKPISRWRDQQLVKCERRVLKRKRALLALNSLAGSSTNRRPPTRRGRMMRQGLKNSRPCSSVPRGSQRCHCSDCGQRLPPKSRRAYRRKEFASCRWDQKVHSANLWCNPAGRYRWRQADPRKRQG